MKIGTAKKKEQDKSKKKSSRLGAFFKSKERETADQKKEGELADDLDIELTNEEGEDQSSTELLQTNQQKEGFLLKISNAFREKPASRENEKEKITKLNSLQRFAYSHISKSLPRLPGYRDAYEQAGLPLIYESYISTAFLISAIAAVPAFVFSFVLELRFLGASLILSVVASLVLAFTVCAVSLFVWLVYPLQRRHSFKSKLERQLAYSLGVLGTLAAAGIRVERLFEELAITETNPVLAELARRFLRNVKVFGLDTETALREVAAHSPSLTFSKMLESLAVAYRTTGSMHDLVTFESGRLFAERKDNLRKAVGDLAVMAELYITLVVVGPIIFIIMLTIFTILPTNGAVPSPIGLINLIVFVGIPAVSAVFMIILDSMISRM